MEDEETVGELSIPGVLRTLTESSWDQTSQTLIKVYFSARLFLCSVKKPVDI